MLDINSIAIKLHWLTAGYCTHPEWTTIQGGSLKQAKFPAGFAFIQHPTLGAILYDTGYSHSFISATSTWPYSLYGAITPAYIEPHDSAAAQLKQMFNIEPEAIRFIIISHFHADHISGLNDFPHAQFICLASAYQYVRNRKTWSALRAGFLPDLMPIDFEERAIFIDEQQAKTIPSSGSFPFSQGYDLLGDGSVIGVNVSGHAEGQMGIFISTQSCSYFLCADAVWSSAAYRELRHPHSLARIIMSSAEDYKRSFEAVCRLHHSYPQLTIIPSHCTEVRSTP